MNHYAFGDKTARINVYVEKAPPSEALWGDLPSSGSIKILDAGDIKLLGEIGGNGWRKVFNVFAKLLCAFPEQSPLRPRGFSSWQSYRDQALLQNESKTALLFGEWDVEERTKNGGIHVIAGRTHALNLGLSEKCVWLNNEFAKHPSLPIFICPYFDYRQLSNNKIDVLVNLVRKIDLS
ncbi:MULTISPECIES: DUF6942 family protein [Grimontia]|uniref:Uracil DNA glycosylase superfamily protein n=1 Tax=Grimontia marina TaxID=646534 RepID=A0A128FG43_9GAMM|nr:MULTISPECIES: hypothetical protein [Grimontia]WRV97981.1 hypothetical protein VP504_00655 [Grimontia sp. NTOU-MAR1]CZF85256.1 hypothetical protein GMA8713_03450 [Grimontia marina]